MSEMPITICYRNELKNRLEICFLSEKHYKKKDPSFCLKQDGTTDYKIAKVVKEKHQSFAI